MTFELGADRSSADRREPGRIPCAAPPGPRSVRRLRQQSDLQPPGPQGATLQQESPPNWLRDAVDVIVLAAILLTIALATAFGS